MVGGAVVLTTGKGVVEGVAEGGAGSVTVLVGAGEAVADGVEVGEGVGVGSCKLNCRMRSA